MNKKKIVFTGIILILVMMFAVTCDTPAAEEVEYTDVVYSPNGSEITLYLDGVGVPVTPAQRAINRELATMAYDFFEVIFIGATGAATATDVARTSWELGQPAGIADVPRGTTGTGIDYGYADNKLSASPVVSIACMFVGKKSDRTLLGIGTLTSKKQKAGTAVLPGTFVDSNTESVKFSIAAIQTGLLVGPTASPTETIDTGNATLGTQVRGVMVDSFKYVDDNLTTQQTTALGTFKSRTAANSTRASVNGSPLSYPRYRLPALNDATVDATYTFEHFDINGASTGGITEYFSFAKVISNTATTGDFPNTYPKVQKRVPRFMSGGRYMEPKEGWTTTTKVNFYAVAGSTNYLTTAITGNPSFGNVVGLRFTITGSGVFSFYIEIPVYMLASIGATKNGAAVAAETWYIRTGVGSELYSLDDGAANGGCVFMSVGESAANWLDIEWTWL